MSLDDTKPDTPDEPPHRRKSGAAKGMKYGGNAGRRRRDEDGLTWGERRFALEYVQSGNLEASALKAGYSAKNSPIAQHLFHRPHVKAFIDRHLAAIERRYEIDAATILKELARVSLADPRRLFDEHGNVKPVTQWTADDAACIAQVDVVKRNVFAGDGQMDTVLKIRLWDKPKSLEILAKHLGLLTERLEIRGDAELVSKLAAARKRVAVAVAVEE